MKYIKISNFVDIASNAFLRVINDTFDRIYYTTEENLFINLNENRTKKLFEYYLGEELRKANRGFGERRIVINTCKPKDNWRKEKRGQAIRAYRYYNVDESVSVDQRKLEQFLDIYWSRCQIDPNVIYLDRDDMDADDYTAGIIKIIGKNFIHSPNHRFLTIGDSNSNYERCLPGDIPDYLLTDIETTLRNANLL